MTKEQTLIYSAYCKECDKDISRGRDQEKALASAIDHCKKNNHELVFGMSVTWFDDPKDQNIPEHVAYCKTCHKDIAKSRKKEAVLRKAMEHCEETKHGLAYGIIVKKS